MKSCCHAAVFFFCTSIQTREGIYLYLLPWVGDTFFLIRDECSVIALVSVGQTCAADTGLKFSRCTQDLFLSSITVKVKLNLLLEIKMPPAGVHKVLQRDFYPLEFIFAKRQKVYFCTTLTQNSAKIDNYNQVY